MKKIIYSFILFLLFIGNIKAFSIDVSKIEIDGKNKELLESLDKSYQIDTSNFESKIIYDEKAQDLAKELLKITVSKRDYSDKYKEMNHYLYISKDNGFDTLTGSVFIQSYLKEVDKHEIEYSYIKSIRTVSFLEEDVMSFIYLPECKVDGEQKDIILSYWMKISDGEYKIYYPWISIADDLEAYFDKITYKENQKEVLGETYNKISLNDESVTVSEDLLSQIYENNVDSVVQITSMLDTGHNSYGSGFYIREGIIVTSWSLFKDYLNDGSVLYVNDANGNVFDVLGVVTADTDYDVVVLKLEKESGKPVHFDESNHLVTGDKVFTINSKINSGFSINYGSFVSLENGKLENLFALSSSEVGSALFDEKGSVVGFNVNDVLNSDLSYAHSTDYLMNLQEILSKKSFAEISTVDTEQFKNKYYFDMKEEKQYNLVSDKIWNKYKNIGDLEKSITLPLIKASYTDGILSLRYKNNISNLIETMYLVSDYCDRLEDSGYQLTYSDSMKKIYHNKEHKIIIKEDLNYLIIIMMED